MKPELSLLVWSAALAFVHPATGERLEFRAPLPARMERLLSHLRDSG